MKSIKTILAACDLSPYTQQVLDYAMTAAKGFNSQLILANIINRRDIEAIEYAVHRALLVEQDISIAEARHQFILEREDALKALGEEHGVPDMIYKTIVRIGIPFQELVDIVKAEKADLVVMPELAIAGYPPRDLLEKHGFEP